MIIFIVARRLENEVKEILEEISQEQEQKKELLQGRQVDLAEELSKFEFENSINSIWLLNQIHLIILI